MSTQYMINHIDLSDPETICATAHALLAPDDDPPTPPSYTDVCAWIDDTIETLQTIRARISSR